MIACTGLIVTKTTVVIDVFAEVVWRSLFFFLISWWWNQKRIKFEKKIEGMFCSLCFFFGPNNFLLNFEATSNGHDTTMPQNAWQKKQRSEKLCVVTNESTRENISDKWILCVPWCTKRLFHFICIYNFFLVWLFFSFFLLRLSPSESLFDWAREIVSSFVLYYIPVACPRVQL